MILWILNILNLLIKSNHKGLQMSQAEFTQTISKKTFQNNSWLVDGYEV